MIVYQAGQIGILEWVLIVIGILWLAGVLRNVVYVPVVIKEKESEKKASETRINEETTISKPGDKKDPTDYTPFEEIKD